MTPVAGQVECITPCLGSGPIKFVEFCCPWFEKEQEMSEARIKIQQAKLTNSFSNHGQPPKVPRGARGPKTPRLPQKARVYSSTHFAFFVAGCVLCLAQNLQI